MKTSAILKISGGKAHAAPAHAPLNGVLREMLVLRVGLLVILDANSEIAGVMTERDLLRNLARQDAR